MKTIAWAIPVFIVVVVLGGIGLSRIPIERIGAPPPAIVKAPSLTADNKPIPPPKPSKEALDYIALADVYYPKIQANVARAKDSAADFYDCGEIESARVSYNRALTFLNAAARLYNARNTMPDAYKRWQDIEESITPGLIWCTRASG